MKIQKLYIIIILFLSLVSCKTPQQKTSTEKSISESFTTNTKENILPQSVGIVNDFEHIFTTEEKRDLENIIQEYEKKTTNEIVIVSINSIEPYKNITEFSIKLANYWGIGKKEKDNGLLIVFSKTLRKIRILTGYGTEKIVTDKICKKIIDTTIVPEFKNGNYYRGIKNGITELKIAWK